MRQTLITIVILILFGGVAFFADRLHQMPFEGASRGPSYATTTLLIGGVPLILEVADTPAKRGLGLGLRKGLSEGRGMLFIFDEAGLHGFWMKDMLFSLDMAWLDDDFCIVSTAKKVAPDTYPTVFVPEAPARYVIELPSGFLGSHNLSKGACAEKPAL